MSRPARTLLLLLLLALVSLPVLALPGSLSVTSGIPSFGVVGPDHPIRPPAAGSSIGSFDWSAYHASENHSGYSPQAGPGNPLGDWSYCEYGNPIRAGPVALGHIVIFADLSGNVYGVNQSENGSRVWNTSLGGETTQLDLAGTTLLADAYPGVLFALDSESGRILWHRWTGPVDQGVTNAQGNVYAVNASGTVYAVNVSTGVLRWELNLNAPVEAAPTFSDGTIYFATATGLLEAFNPNGAHLWTSSFGALDTTAPAVSGDTVVVADFGGNVTSFWTSNGTERWKVNLSDPSYVTPAVGFGLVVVAPQSSSLDVLSLSSGHRLWTVRGGYVPGFPSFSAPAIAPSGVYFYSVWQEILGDYTLNNGTLTWSSLYPDIPSYDSAALVNGEALLGYEDGCLTAVGHSPGVPEFRVTGFVTDRRGTPVDGATVGAGTSFSLTDPKGGFSLLLANGTYNVTITKDLHDPLTLPLTVAGPHSGLRFVLSPLTVYPIAGRVVDAASAAGIGKVILSAVGSWGYSESVQSSSNGSFELFGPNGSVALTIAPLGRYPGTNLTVVVAGGPLQGVSIRLPPPGFGAPPFDPWGIAMWAPVGAAVFAPLGFYALHARRQRIAAGISGSILSPFSRFLVMRALLIPGQFLALALLVFTALEYIPRVVQGNGYCPRGQAACEVHGFTSGFVNSVSFFVSGNWFANVPYIGDSVEVIGAAFLIALAIAYPLGLLSGWRRGSASDGSIRGFTLVGLLVPTFLIVILLITAVFPLFYQTFGDTPFYLMPTPPWFISHGGFPTWISPTQTTSPTGVPLVDGALHGDWPFVNLVLSKVLLQAAFVAIVYVTIFLRYARQAVLQASQELFVTAARARGVSEPELLWRHMARRYLPFYAVLIGLTLPAFVGTEAVVEVLFNDHGIGLSLVEPTGAFVEGPIFLLVLFVLVGMLFADTAAKLLDPRLAPGVAR